MLTHDVNTIPKYAYEMLINKQAVPGILLIAQDVPIGQVIEDIILIDACSETEEWLGLIHYLPF